MRRALLVMVLLALALPWPAAQGHGGGLDSNGGHHCREAGYDTGHCAPLGSYHCHRSPCGETATTSPPQTAPPDTRASSGSGGAGRSGGAGAAVTTSTTSTTTSTTTSSTTSTTVPPTTTTAAEEIDVEPAASGDDVGFGDMVLTAGVLGGLLYGGYRLVRLVRPRTAGD